MRLSLRLGLGRNLLVLWQLLLGVGLDRSLLHGFLVRRLLLLYWLLLCSLLRLRMCLLLWVGLRLGMLELLLKLRLYLSLGSLERRLGMRLNLRLHLRLCLRLRLRLDVELTRLLLWLKLGLWRRLLYLLGECTVWWLLLLGGLLLWRLRQLLGIPLCFVWWLLRVGALSFRRPKRDCHTRSGSVRLRSRSIWRVGCGCAVSFRWWIRLRSKTGLDRVPGLWPWCGAGIVCRVSAVSGLLIIRVVPSVSLW